MDTPALKVKIQKEFGSIDLAEHTFQFDWSGNTTEAAKFDMEFPDLGGFAKFLEEEEDEEIDFFLNIRDIPEQYVSAIEAEYGDAEEAPILKEFTFENVIFQLVLMCSEGRYTGSRWSIVWAAKSQ